MGRYVILNNHQAGYIGGKLLADFWTRVELPGESWALEPTGELTPARWIDIPLTAHH
jgi:hypothetical protein